MEKYSSSSTWTIPLYFQVFDIYGLVVSRELFEALKVKRLQKYLVKLKRCMLRLLNSYKDLLEENRQSKNHLFLVIQAVAMADLKIYFWMDSDRRRWVKNVND